MSDLKRRRASGALLAVLAALVPLAVSPAGAGAQSTIGTPPVVTNVHAEPSSLPSAGGLVTIFADAHDDNGGVTSMQAQVQGPFGGPEIVLMDFTNVGETFSGSLTIPANFTDSPMNYSVTVTAIDTDGDSTSAGGSGITVDAAPPPVDERPVVSNAEVFPTTLPRSGGTTQIRANVTDDRAVSTVSATVTKPDGTTATVPMSTAGATQYQANFAVPANTRTTPAQYTIEVTALDDAGQSASASAGTLTVAPTPPPPPAFAELKVNPNQLSFRALQVGDRSRGSIVVRNAGGKSAATVSGVVAVSGAGFTIVGASPTGAAFTLRPGESKVITVEFRPASPGSYRGTLNVRRSDGLQPGLAVRLSGDAYVKKHGH